MKRVCFITDRKDFFPAACYEGDFDFSFIPPSSWVEGGFSSSGMPSPDYCIIARACVSANLEPVLKSMGTDPYAICLIDAMDDDLRSVLVRNGVTDVIDPNQRRDLVTYIETLEDRHLGMSGNIVVLDDDEVHRRAIRNIVSRFGYRVLYADRAETMIELMQKPNLQFVLVNLGIDACELNEFLRHHSIRVEMRSTPVIAYRDMSSGPYIHEFLRGLNRLTRFILSPDELYGFLVDIMFKKDIMPLLDGLNYSVDYKSSSHYAQEPLKRIYYINEGELFRGENILRSENLDRIEGVLSLINKSLSRVRGLKWLRRDVSRADFTTCGAGV